MRKFGYKVRRLPSPALQLLILFSSRIARYLRGSFVLRSWCSPLLACGSKEILPRIYHLHILDQHGALYA